MTTSRLGPGLRSLVLPALLASTPAACDGTPTETPPAAPASSASDATADAAGPVKPLDGPADSSAPPQEPTTTMTTEEQAAHAIAFAGANNDFAFRMYAQMLGAPEHRGLNLAFSPASIELAMAMTAGGAKGPTREQMTKTMGFGDADFDQLSEGAMAHWRGAAARSVPLGPATTTPPPPGVQLHLANRLFGERTYAFEAPFLDRTAAVFGAPLQPVDFLGDAEGQRAVMNAWVLEQTRDKIRELIPAGGVDAMTALVLVNAVYFYGSWAKPFSESATQDAPFRVGGGAGVAMPTMNLTHTLAHSASGGVTVVDIPYVGAQFSMTIAMPDDDFARFEGTLTRERWDALTGGTTQSSVALSLPRFTIDPAASVELKAALSAMGMPMAFSAADADFSAMANPPRDADRLYISKVFHKAFVDVNEAGTEAAAATAVVMTRKGAARPSEPTVARIDRPFVFAIRERTSGTIVFMGRVLDPRG